MYSAGTNIGILTNTIDWVILERSVGVEGQIEVTRLPGVKQNGRSNILNILLAASLSVLPARSTV